MTILPARRLDALFESLLPAPPAEHYFATRLDIACCPDYHLMLEKVLLRR
ncbi:MAG: hypothetical protein HY581_06130 [Nitrospirae bacterium]|nr:hypothetical protein [Nitrospirota bacterium]